MLKKKNSASTKKKMEQFIEWKFYKFSSTASVTAISFDILTTFGNVSLEISNTVFLLRHRMREMILYITGIITKP